VQSGVTQNEEISSLRRKRDTRTFFEKYRAFCTNYDTSLFLLGIILLAIVILGFVLSLPFASELILLSYILGPKKYFDFKKRAFDFPYRIPKLANVLDGSYSEAKLAQGITYLGNDKENYLPIYLTDSDLRAHLLVLGTTGSGKTVFLISIFTNALIQNTGAFYNDGKGDSTLPKEIYRIARRLGREDDILIINFITSGRDFIDKQEDKITNNINFMANTSSGMLIETIVGLLDDAGGGNDMWKGRAISFIGALTRPLCYLRDKGFLCLSAETYLHYFELHNLEDLIYDPKQLFGQLLDEKEFKKVTGALYSYIVNLPGYNSSLYAHKKRQDQKTLEQHGYITMQLTRVFNDLTYNYAHIFETEVGEIDFYDVVLNRRILVALLPSSERSPDSLQMLGKLILSNLKQMIAGCLGNSVEGLVRAIIDSRPTNASVPYYVILDEYGYYAVKGFANLAAQSRSLGFSITFAAQDFASLRRTNEQEADSTWENTNLRAVGRITSGVESDTWRKVSGAAGSAYIANLSSFDRETGVIDDKLLTPNSLGISRSERLDYDDLASQENGEFTYIIGKKENCGKSQSVRVIRGMSYYVASEQPPEMRINDFIPILPPEKNETISMKDILQNVIERMESESIDKLLTSNIFCKSSNSLNAIMAMYEYMNQADSKIDRPQQSLAIMHWLFNKFDQPTEFGNVGSSLFNNSNKIDSEKLLFIRNLFDQVVSDAVREEKNHECVTSKHNEKISYNVNLAEDDEEIFDENIEQDKNIVINSINVIDSICIPSESPDELDSILNSVKLFRNNNYSNDLVNKDQLHEFYQITSESSNLDTDAEYKNINRIIKEQTTYVLPEKLPNTNMFEADLLMKETLDLVAKLKSATIQNINKINKKIF
jgi:intracellular multiplication protein IcmO